MPNSSATGLIRPRLKTLVKKTYTFGGCCEPEYPNAWKDGPCGIVSMAKEPRAPSMQIIFWGRKYVHGTYCVLLGTPGKAPVTTWVFNEFMSAV